MAEPEMSWDRFRVGDLIVDARRRRVSRDDKIIRLSKLSLDLLLQLVQAEGNLVTSESLLANVWKGKIVGPETITQRVKLVRDALGDDSHHPRYVEVVWGEGYRICVGVERLPEEAGARIPTGRRVRWRLNIRFGFAAVLTLLGAVVIVSQVTDRPLKGAVEIVDGRVGVAVVPTMNLTGTAAMSELGVALGARMTSELSRLGSVDAAVPATAEYLLRSAMVRSGDDDAVRFAASLVDTADGKTLWSGFFDLSAQDADRFAEQSAAEVVRNIQLSLLPAEARRLAIAQPATDDVERLHREGRQALENGNLAGAFEKLSAVISLDPKRAQAHSDIARALIQMGWYTEVTSGEVIPQAEAAARAALEIDPSLAEPYLVLANAAAFYHWEWQRAEALYKDALARNPGHAPTYLDYAAYLFVVGRIDEGLLQIRQAEAVDPFSADTHGQIGVLYHYIRNWEAAHRHYDTAIGLQPDNLFWQVNKGCTFIFQGEFEKGAAIITGLREIVPEHPMPMVIDAYFAAVTGDDGRARTLLAQIDAKQLAPISELMRASIYVALRRNTDAVALLQLAKDKRLLALPFSAIHPTHDPLRSQTEYANLVRDLGLRPVTEWPMTSPGGSL